MSRPADTSAQRAFIGMVARGAIVTQREYGVPAAVTIAQAIDESGWGKSGLATKARNLFGIKGTGPAGSDSQLTQEYENGQLVTKIAAFRVYRDVADSIGDHARLLATSGYYRQAMAERHDPDAFAAALTGVYATNPDYGTQLISLMRRYNLYRFDRAARLGVRHVTAGGTAIPGLLPADPAPLSSTRSNAPASHSPAPPDRSPVGNDRSSAPHHRSPAPPDRDQPAPQPSSPVQPVRQSSPPLAPGDPAGQPPRAVAPGSPARRPRTEPTTNAPASRPSPAPTTKAPASSSAAASAAASGAAGQPTGSKRRAATPQRRVPMPAPQSVSAQRLVTAAPKSHRAGTSKPAGRARYQAQMPASVRNAFLTTAQVPLLHEEPLYRDVASHHGIRWELLAACDWMQCEAHPRHSPVHGERLGTVNPDGTVYRTRSEALERCAEDLVELAAAVYQVDVTAPGYLTVRDLANMFAAFRWGGLLRLHRTSALEFPYSVAGLTVHHTSMRWPNIAEPNAPDKPGGRFRQPFGAVPIVVSLHYPAAL